MNTQLRDIPIGHINLDPENVRRDVGDIDDLAISIAVDGIISPLLVCVDERASGRFRLIAGHRRLAAAKKAGLATVPAQVREATTEQSLSLQLIENIERDDLSAIEIAEGLQRLVALLGDSEDIADKVAERVHRKVGWVRRHLGLLKIDTKVIRAIQRNGLGLSMAAEVARIARTGDAKKAIETANAISTGDTNRAKLRAERKPSAAMNVQLENVHARLTFTSGVAPDAVTESAIREHIAAIDRALRGAA